MESPEACLLDESGVALKLLIEWTRLRHASSDARFLPGSGLATDAAVV
jgi:hypothetical protein